MERNYAQQQRILRGLLLFGTALLIAGCVTASYSKRSAGYVVVPAREFFAPKGSLEWSPTDAEVAACEAALARELSNADCDLSRYYLRLSGTVRNGARHLVGFAGLSRGYLKPPSEETILLPPFGGGKTFFRFDYDADRRKLVQFEFGAPL